MKGISVVRLHYTADPTKATPEWLARQQVGYAPDRWAREMEMDAQAGSQAAIFRKEYHPTKHERALAPPPDRSLLHGWDFGKGFPAHVWGGRTQYGGLRVYGSAFGRNIQLAPFVAQCVATEVERWGLHQNRRDYCDPAGNQEKDDGRKSVEVLRNYGYRPVWRGSGIEERIRLFSTLLLQDQLDGEPMVLLDPRYNRELIEAIRSEYKRGAGDQPERIHPYIDLVDALMYLVINTQTFHQKRSVRPPDLSQVSDVSGYGAWTRRPETGGSEGMPYWMAGAGDER